jgi:hypothetical protein
MMEYSDSQRKEAKRRRKEEKKMPLPASHVSNMAEEVKRREGVNPRAALRERGGDSREDIKRTQDPTLWK